MGAVRFQSSGLVHFHDVSGKLCITQASGTSVGQLYEHTVVHQWEKLKPSERDTLKRDIFVIMARGTCCIKREVVSLGACGAGNVVLCHHLVTLGMPLPRHAATCAGTTFRDGKARTSSGSHGALGLADQLALPLWSLLPPNESHTHLRPPTAPVLLPPQRARCLHAPARCACARPHDSAVRVPLVARRGPAFPGAGG